ncbi:glyoxalase/bleomycin resistance protein/dioxygenase superfamily protein [Kordia sp. SMS9]|uniref:VOC family protein n=1 Tax=Kordia sp. SMS9 TaxID=2282170 RepID=UPI000E0D1AAF|nr:VOC family protein [Kordia sp. SMS9]AXG68540.1 glyoxalase/bleomycin resistance protein/dioxygenase superfamily protein [Kordia sp. SMS9]
MQPRVTIIGLGVENLETATAFYQEKFGWKLTNASNDNISFFQLNGVLLSLYPREKLAEDATVSPEGSGFKGFTLAYNTRTKEEVDEVFADLTSKGVKIVKQPEEVFWGGYSGYVADLDENLWEIAYNPFLELDADGNPLE